MDTTLKPSWTYSALIALVAIACIAVIPWGIQTFPRTNRFDLHDVHVYFTESGWVAGEGMLYRDVPSEYPPLANVLFGVCRLASDWLLPGGGGAAGFTFVWMATAWLVFLAVGHVLATRVGLSPVWIWLTPGAVFFALFRFDIFPAAATVLALLALRADRHYWGAFWIGIVLALKGYALFCLPAFFVYMVFNRGWRNAVGACALALTPFVLGNLLVLVIVGLDGMLSPFRFHSVRINNGESTYDAFYYLTPYLFSSYPTIRGLLPMTLMAGSALLAAALRPRTFDELVNALMVSILGFISASVFYSPQFCLWVLPLACFATERITRRLAILFSWATFLYFPMFFLDDAKKATLATAAGAAAVIHLGVFRLLIVSVAALRLSMMAAAVRAVWVGRRAADAALAVQFTRCPDLSSERRMAWGREALASQRDDS